MTKLTNFASLKDSLENHSSQGAIRSYLGACGVAVALLGGTAAADAQGMTMPPAPPSLIGPSMDGPLSANPTPFVMDLGFLGDKVYAGGVLSGIAWVQDQATTNHNGGYDYPSGLDIANAQLFIQKTDGIFQYYIQAGDYSFPSLATPFSKSSDTVSHTFGVVPIAFVKIVPNDTMSFEVGKLPTLVGAEYTFTFQNMNIIRGLLWNQEPAISQGVQANLTTGPLAWSVSLNDGFYSGRYNWISGSVAWTIDMADTLTFVGGGNYGHTNYQNNGKTAVPTAQNNGDIFNLIYTHSDGPLVVTAYGQYASTPTYQACTEGSGTFETAKPCTIIQKFNSASSWGLALLASYAFNDNFKLAGRVEYISASSSTTVAGETYSDPTYTFGSTTSLLGFGGPNASAWSFTVTPTYQYKNFYVRAEYSLVDISSSTKSSQLLGPNGNSSTQDRGLLEVGVLY